MANKFEKKWGSHLKKLKPTPGSTDDEGTLIMRDTGDPRHIKVKHASEDDDETDAETPDTTPPSISFKRRPKRGPRKGGLIEYWGVLIVESPPAPPPSRIKGTFKFTPATPLSPLAGEGEWTANRPPPKPPKRSRDRGAGAKKATAGKAAAVRKSAAGKKSLGSKKAGVSGKAASKKKSAAPAKKASKRR